MTRLAWIVAFGIFAGALVLLTASSMRAIRAWLHSSPGDPAEAVEEEEP